MPWALDPRNTTTASDTEPSCNDWPIQITGPNGQQRMPNLVDWRPGDVLLFSRNVSGWDIAASCIELYQRSTPDDLRLAGEAEWVHAAIYLGGGLIVESVLGNVFNPLREFGVAINPASLPTRLSQQKLRVRRFNAMAIGEHDRNQEIADAASRMVGKSYPVLLSLLIRLMREERGEEPRKYAALRHIGRLFSGGAVHCSLLCTDAVREVYGIDLNRFRLDRTNDVAVPVTYPSVPAVLAMSEYLDDVALEWRSVR